jgi:anti-sigma factor ChrR (cupin superfamily)
MKIGGQGEEHAPSVWATLYALGELNVEDRDFFERHLDAGCAECQSELRTFARIMARLGVEISSGPPKPADERFPQNQGQVPTTQTKYPGVLLQKAGLLITRSAGVPWNAAPIPGVQSKSLFVDNERKYSTSLVRLAAKTVYPPHRHNDIEEVFVLEGDLVIEGVHMVSGDFCRSEPGSIHGATTTECGALLLVTASQQDEILS